MIIYKCDLCGASMRAADVVTVRAVRTGFSRGFDICGDCYGKLAEQAKATEEKATRIPEEDDPEVCKLNGLKCDYCLRRFACREELAVEHRKRVKNREND